MEVSVKVDGTWQHFRTVSGSEDLASAEIHFASLIRAHTDQEFWMGRKVKIETSQGTLILIWKGKKFDLIAHVPK